MPSTLVAILLEIDYSIEETVGIKFENYKEDQYDDRFTSIISIFAIIDRYIENNKSCENMINSLDVNKINVSELISDIYPNHQINLLADYLVVLTTIGPNKDTYLEKVGELPEDLINFFLEIIDNFLSPMESQSNGEHVGDISIVSKAAEIKNEVFRKQSLAQSRLNSIILNASILEDRGGTSILINNNRNSNALGYHFMELKLQNKCLLEETRDKDMKIKDLTEKLAIQKLYEEDAYRREEYFTKELEGMMELKTLIQEKEKEIEEQKKININGSKKYIEEISQLKEKINGYKGKEDEHRTTLKESEKLRARFKDYETVKSKAEEYDNLKVVVESLNNELDVFRKEKALMLHKIDVLKHDYMTATEKIKNLENEKLNMQNDLLAARKDFNEEKKRQTMISIGFRKSIKRKSTCRKTEDIDDSKIDNLEHLMKENETILEEEDNENANENIINELERENAILKAEFDELKQKYDHLDKGTRNTKIGKSILRPRVDDNEELERLTREKQDLLKANLDLNALIVKIENDKKKAIFDLLEKSAIISQVVEERMIIEQSLKKATEKMENLISKNTNLEKEITNLKEVIDDNNKLIAKLIDEKNMIKLNSTCSKEELIDQMKVKEKLLMKTVKDLEIEVAQKSGLISKIENLNEMLVEIRSEAKEIQLNLNIKSNKLKECEEKLLKKEEKLIMLSVKIKELESNYNTETDRMQSNHQKKVKSLEDQCSQTASENKLVLDRIYEMALKYNNMKSEYEELKHRVLED